MKLDPDLVRKVLSKAEDLPLGEAHGIEVEGHSDDEVTYHVMLLAEAGLLDALDVSSHDGVAWLVRRPTYAGHEFLAAAQSDTVWAQAKGWLQKATGAVTSKV